MNFRSLTQRPAALVWLACGLAALLMSASVSGTLSNWTQAIVANNTNTAGTATAVILQETSGANTCVSSAVASNSATCSTINKYGGTGTPLQPGGSQSVDVTFSNIGGAAASSFVFAPGTCSQTPTAGTGTPAATNLCTSGDLTVAVSCSNGTTYNAGSAWADLVQTAVAPGSLTQKTRTATLAAGSSWTCRFTVALSSNAPVAAQGIQVSQSLTWTLNK